MKNFPSFHCFFTTAFTSSEVMLIFSQYTQLVPHPLSSHLKIKFIFSPLLREHIILSAPQRELFSSQIIMKSQLLLWLKEKPVPSWLTSLTRTSFDLLLIKVIVESSVVSVPVFFARMGSCFCFLHIIITVLCGEIISLFI